MPADVRDERASDDIGELRSPLMTSSWSRRLIALRLRPFARAVAVVAAGSALGQTVTIIASPLIARLYSPADFGIASVYVSLLSLAVVVSALRYDTAIPLPADEAIARGLLDLSFFVALVTTALVAAAVAICGDSLVEWSNAPGLRPLLWLLPPGFLIAASYQVLTSWCVRERAYERIARAHLARGIGIVTTQCGLGVFGAGPIGLLVGDMLGQGAGTATLASLAGNWRLRTEWRGRLVNALRAARVYYRFPAFLAGSSLLSAGGVFLPPILLARHYGPDVAGLFALAQKVVEAPVRLIGQSVAQVYFAEAAAVAREDAARLPRMFFGAARKLFIVGSIPVLIGGLASPWLFDAVFGASWRDAGTVARALSWYVAARFVAYPLSHTLNIVGRQELQMGWDLLRFSAVLGTIPIGARAGWAAGQTIQVFALAMAAAYLILFLLGVREVGRISRGRSKASGAQVPTQ